MARSISKIEKLRFTPPNRSSTKSSYAKRYFVFDCILDRIRPRIFISHGRRRTFTSMKTLYTHPCYPDAMNFISSRLSTFPRVYYPWFCEVITEKYGIDQPANLFSELIESGAVGLHNHMIYVKNGELLNCCNEKALDASFA
jgi:hypothetical protein